MALMVHNHVTSDNAWVALVPYNMVRARAIRLQTGCTAALHHLEITLLRLLTIQPPKQVATSIQISMSGAWPGEKCALTVQSAIW